MTNAGSLSDSKPVEPTRRLDTSGKLCPVPVVEARSMLAEMRPGEVLDVIATDPLAELDLAVMCERTGHRLLSAVTRDGVVRVRIEVGVDSRAR
ncbi:sulfurtransferase TusA family protein [Wenzhouxiangella marina]|uniref:SirA family protein n=2 Tax=Wenzhouxiangella marina TaxID=1579979 RepID=A0A0K0XSP6_9GAMM|nr:sulfurtransferase TusA family protein [Wenzhouxiangella marina]AKS40656.1 SirA family protein [Wenzhouxiangella marina]